MRFSAIAFAFFTTAVGVFASPVVTERQTTLSVATVLTDLSDTILPLVDQLLHATSENATQVTLTLIIDDISTAVTDAVSILSSLKGKSADMVLASVDGTTLSSTDIATLLAEVVSLILKAAFAALKVVDSALESTIYDLVSELGKVVFGLLGTVLSLVDGLLGPLLTLLEPVFSIMISLGLKALLGALIGGLL